MSKNTHKVTAETITPVHIGNGVELNGNFEYLYFSEEGQLAILDSNKVLDIIGVENINHWVSIVDKGEDLLAYLRKRSPNIVIEDVADRVIDILEKAPSPHKNKLKEQLHLGAKRLATIPGSSLKGSFRTAILTKLIKDSADFVRKESNLKSRNGRFNDKELQKKYLGRTPNDDLLRFLRLSDFSFSTNTCVVKNNIINLFRNGWDEKKRQSSFWECIPKGAKSTGSIQIPTDLMKQVQNKHFMSGQNFNLLDPKRLFKLINKHTLELVADELDFWDYENNPLAIGDYMEHLEKVENILKNINENSCVIRVGAGVGWDSMTGAWPRKDDVYQDEILSSSVWSKLKQDLRRNKYGDDVVFPKTRKLIDGGLPLGFVKLVIC